MATSVFFTFIAHSPNVTKATWFLGFKSLAFCANDNAFSFSFDKSDAIAEAIQDSHEFSLISNKRWAKILNFSPSLASRSAAAYFSMFVTRLLSIFTTISYASIALSGFPLKPSHRAFIIKTSGCFGRSFINLVTCGDACLTLFLSNPSMASIQQCIVFR